MSHNRIVSNESVNDEQTLELSLRPKCLSDYFGQNDVKSKIKVYVKAAIKRKESLDHVLLYGPPGLGKTTLAMIIANELNVNIHITSGPSIEKTGDLVSLLNDLSPGDVIFIDEIHRIPKIVEEMLYSAMEDFYIDIIVGQGSSSHSIHFPLPPFTLIGATTKIGLLSSPLRERFGIIERMSYYKPEELTKIIKRSSNIFNIKIDDDASYEIAKRSRGTPRIANRLLKRIRDFADVKNYGEITKKLAENTLTKLKVDKEGLDDIDREILYLMIKEYNGGPVGLNTISDNIGEDADTISSVYEPYLLQKNFIKRTSRGRIATTKAYQHLKIPITKEDNYYESKINSR